ncbi:hypothetical protein KAK07_02875 [Ideonella sp. 4Y16]|uniref:hypothetical protein n=1 Tax=Ideonella alba TaxID=2824118 RepID=UPI001B38B64B|nr:hypothetical protein [Ideonella alba]MBQ0942274.1 hypothetical protein [Ideonella alba]
MHPQDDDPDAVRRLQPRARDLLARADRMQQLHGLAYDAQRLSPTTGQAPATPRPDHPQAHLEGQAAQAVLQAHAELQQAAQLARQLAAQDPVLARLHTRLHGGLSPELPPVVPADGAGAAPLAALPPPTKG